MKGSDNDLGYFSRVAYTIIMSLRRKRSLGRASQHPELDKEELKLNDSDDYNVEVFEINNVHCELVKATR